MRYVREGHDNNAGGTQATAIAMAGKGSYRALAACSRSRNLQDRLSEDAATCLELFCSS